MSGRHSSQQQDLNKISELHHRDAEASKSGDFETLRSLLSEDAVLMPPGENWIRGSEALDQLYAQMAETMREGEVMHYELDFEEVIVLGDHAFEWGSIRGAMRPRGSNTPVSPESSSYKVLRVLKKTPDGDWRVHRAMWNAISPGS